ncbi:hypothetical protein GCM10029978_017620 [Actinoallomurus acanthiterrae]
MSLSESEVRSYTGGFSMPMRGGTGRITLDRPFARLELRPRRASLHPRGPFRLVLESRSLPFTTVQEAFPTAPVILSGPGVGLRCVDGDYYFWTRHAREVLDVLESAGIPVDPSPRRLRPGSLTGVRGGRRP